MVIAYVVPEHLEPIQYYGMKGFSNEANDGSVRFHRVVGGLRSSFAGFRERVPARVAGPVRVLLHPVERIHDLGEPVLSRRERVQLHDPPR